MNEIFGLILCVIFGGLMILLAITSDNEAKNDYKKKNDNDEDFNIAIS